MAEHMGIVKEIENNDFARVLTGRKKACGGCESNPGGCRSCLAGTKMESRVANRAGARVGDVAKVGLSSRELFSGAIILYLLPVAALMAGAFAGTAAAPRLGGSEPSVGLIGALIGVVCGYLAVIALDRNARVRRRLMPRITEVVSSQIGPQGSGRVRVCG